MTNCDMASIKIHTKDLALFFNNGVGDFPNKVKILNKKEKPKGEFIEHFTVKTTAYLSRYDCDDSKIHTFKKGRYFVFLTKDECVFEIQKVDEDIHA